MKLFSKIFALFLNTQSCLSQDIHKIRGHITDLETGPLLVGANVIDIDSGMGVTSNADGYYSITVNLGFVVLASSFIGYSTDTLFVEIKRDLSHNFELQTNAYNSSEVTLEDNR